MPACLSCGRGLCDECHIETEPCCLADIQSSNTYYPSPVSSKSSRQIPDDQVRDPRSTMRKRAQKLLESERMVSIGSPCEWRGLANVGGGNHPIVGCRDGEVKHVHHGPDKNWYHNTPDNLHGICNGCHRRWHNRNDRCYNPDIPNTPRLATEEELTLWNENYKDVSLVRPDHKDCIRVVYEPPIKPQ